MVSTATRPRRPAAPPATPKSRRSAEPASPPPPPPDGPDGSPYVDTRVACRILSGVGRRRLAAIAEAANIRVLRLPGCPPKYSRDDLIRLARESVQTAAPRSAG